MNSVFLDTYALFEILNGNASHVAYLKETRATTTLMNLLELYYGVLRKFGKSDAERAYEGFRALIVDIEEEDAKNAATLRVALKRRDVSYIDCLGYAVALRLGMPFLTGDIAFKDLANVAFVR